MSKSLNRTFVTRTAKSAFFIVESKRYNRDWNHRADTQTANLPSHRRIETVQPCTLNEPSNRRPNRNQNHGRIIVTETAITKPEQFIKPLNRNRGIVLGQTRSHIF